MRHGSMADGLAFALAACGPAAFGQTYGIDFRNTLMPASGGLAGTSVEPSHDFLSAINANPAARTHSKGTRFTIGRASAEVTVDLEQTSPIPLLGVAPFSAKSSTPGAIVPAIGVAHEVDGLWLPTTAGLAVLGAAGGGSSPVQVPAGARLEPSTSVNVARYRIGLGFTWHFDRLPAGDRSSGL